MPGRLDRWTGTSCALVAGLLAAGLAWSSTCHAQAHHPLNVVLEGPRLREPMADFEFGESYGQAARELEDWVDDPDERRRRRALLRLDLTLQIVLVPALVATTWAAAESSNRSPQVWASFAASTLVELAITANYYRHERNQLLEVAGGLLLWGSALIAPFTVWATTKATDGQYDHPGRAFGAASLTTGLAVALQLWGIDAVSMDAPNPSPWRALVLATLLGCTASLTYEVASR